MTEFNFVLKFNLATPADNPADCLESLGSAGCTDALVGVGQFGIIALDFTREASSARSAVVSAIRDVQTAIPGATLVEATPDLVGLSDVADVLGFSRQYLRKLAHGCVPDFPTPIHEGRPSIWHLAPVLRWFESSRQTQIDAAMMDLARFNMHLNIAVSEVGSDHAEIDVLRTLLSEGETRLVPASRELALTPAVDSCGRIPDNAQSGELDWGPPAGREVW